MGIVRSLLLAIVLMPIALSVHGEVTVSYGDPDRFTDMADSNTDPRNAMDDLAQHLQKLGHRYLPREANLTIRVLDVDRAGRPFQGLPNGLRVMNGKADFPCIELEWSLGSSAGAHSSRERVCDRDFLRRPDPSYSEHDPLVYEKRMLDTWFRAHFGEGRIASKPAR